MRRSLLLPFCLATVALAGCGNKGALYLPPRPAPGPVPASAATMAAPASPASVPAPASH